MRGDTEISNSENVIDSRDIIARIEYLESELADLEENVASAQEKLDSIDTTLSDSQGFNNESEREAAQQIILDEIEEANGDIEEAAQAVNEWQSDYGDELKALQDLQSEAEGYAPDWHYGATLIHEAYFVTYAQELCEDVGAIPRDIPDYIVIDWDATAENLKADYTKVDFDGTTYLVR